MSKNARSLRGRMTDAERKLWTRLRNRQLAGHKFRRQVPLGKFVADFACYDARLVVELDGGQHAGGQHVGSRHVGMAEDDAVRRKWLEDRGFLILRFWNNEVLENMEGVLETIARTLEERPPPHTEPLPPGEK